MCGTCHVEQDDRFPSTLELPTERPRCSDCHNRLENPKVDWIKDQNRPCRIAEVTGGKALADLLRQTVNEELKTRGFPQKGPPDESVLGLHFTVMARKGTARRFLPETQTAVICEIEVTLRDGETNLPVYRRIVHSKPHSGRTAQDARRLALLDAWRVLKPHLLEACCIY